MSQHPEELLLVELERRDDFVVASTSIQTEFCQTCRNAVAHYKCPGCQLRNCSIACINRHKTERNCSGKRPLATRIPINEFSDATFARDVRFLDNLAQIAERSARITSRQFAARVAAQSSGRRHLAPAVFRRKCEERKIHLRLCPSELSMRKCNTTQLTKRTKKLSWRVHWEFPHCNKSYTDLA